MNTTRDLCTAAREAAHEAERLAKEEKIRQAQEERAKWLADQRAAIKKIVGEEFYDQCVFDPDNKRWLICGEFFVVITQEYDSCYSFNGCEHLRPIKILKNPYLHSWSFANAGDATDLASLGQVLERLVVLNKEHAEWQAKQTIQNRPWYKKLLNWLPRDKDNS